MKKVRIAQIGTSNNSHGSVVFDSLKKQNDIFEVAGYAMPENEKEKFASQMSHFDGACEMTVDEIANDPAIEAVTVETEEIYLTKYAQKMADCGKHIHMEKPGGINPADFNRLIETVRKNGTVFHTGYMYRYNPYVIELLRKVQDGELGDIISVEAQMSCIHTTETRQWLSNFPGGMMFFLGCHLVDLILQIQGMPEKVIPFNKSTGVDGVTSDDFGMAVFEYENGISFVKTSACEIGGYARRQLVVTGTRKTVELKPFERTFEGSLLYTGCTEYSETSWSDVGVYSAAEPFDRYDTMMSAFAAMVKGEKKPYSCDYELTLYHTLLKACGVKK